MRSLIPLFCLTLLVWTQAWAATGEVPARHFYAAVETPYSTTWYKVFEKNGKTFCQTKGTGVIEAHENPLAGTDFKSLTSNESVAACRQKVHIRDARGAGAETRFEGCYTVPAFRDLMLGLDRGCRP